MADSVSNHQPHDCLLNRLFSRRSKKISKLRVTGLCAGNSPGTGEFPAQMASNAENVSIWWRHHAMLLFKYTLYALLHFFQSIYHRGGLWIFEMHGDKCSTYTWVPGNMMPSKTIKTMSCTRYIIPVSNKTWYGSQGKHYLCTCYQIYYCPIHCSKVYTLDRIATDTLFVNGNNM